MAFAGNELGKGLYNGCIGLATCHNPFQPQLLPPLLSPGLYAEMECPQVIFSGNYIYLFFSVLASKYQPEWLVESEVIQGGLHCYVANGLGGQFVPAGSNGLILDTGLERYAYALVEQRGNKIVMIGFNNFDRWGNFMGGPTLPLRLRLERHSVIVENWDQNVFMWFQYC